MEIIISEGLQKEDGALRFTQLKSVIPIGFEPMTYSLEGCRSIQLSYGTWISLRSAKIIFFSLQTRSDVNNGCKNFPRLEKSPLQ
jgi:hypothetical protein